LKERMTGSRISRTYKNKRVLVTGHTGFKGSWLSVWLRELGANVIGYALEPPSDPSNFEACNLKAVVTHCHGDVRDLDDLLEVFAEYKPEIVFHLAAQALVRLSYHQPKNTFDTNVGGTVNVLEAVRLNPSVKVFVNITSDKCYENREWVWGYRENDPLGGDDPYSASKGCAELAFSAYRKSFFDGKSPVTRKIGVASVRAGNVIGGGDWGDDRLIPDCVRALVKNQPVGIRSPRATRPWQHVLEPLGGYLLLGALLWEDPVTYCGSWNFGPSEADYRYVEEIVSRFLRFWGSGGWTDLSDSDNRLHEATTLRLTCDKAHRYLNWQPVLNLDDSLRMTAHWYKTYYAGGQGEKDMCSLCRDQIRFYVRRAKKSNVLWVE
jgi:CDP-glucose 4,6-dehydratase